MCLRRSCEARPREGQALFALHRRLGACQTRVGVRSTACGPAHPVDGSRPRNRARRTYPNGENNGTRAGVPALSHARVHACCPVPRYSTLFAACLRPPSRRYLEPQKHPGWSWRRSVRSCRWALGACMLCTGCDARVHGWRSDRCPCRCRCDVSRVTRAQNSGPLWTQMMILSVLDMVKHI